MEGNAMTVATLEQSAHTVPFVGDIDLGKRIRARRVALGMSVTGLAKAAGVDRSRISAAESGASIRSSTLGAIETALEQAEKGRVTGGTEGRAGVTSHLELPDGTRVTFIGSAEDVADAARRFASRRKGQ